jgi:uncharacterized protein
LRTLNCQNHVLNDEFKLFIQELNVNKNTIGHKILHFPLTKIIIGLVVCVGAVALGQLLVLQLLQFTSLEKDLKNLISGVCAAIIALFAYRYLFRVYEKRTVTELAKLDLIKNVTLGIALGATLQALTILVIYLKGGYQVLAINPFIFIIPPLAMALTSAIFEEILLRGIIFRIAEEKLGSYFALIISAVLFGAMHLANPHSSFTAATAIAIQAGLLLAAAYIYSRSLWLPIAIHFAWNFTQSAIFGANVSGNAVSKTLITSKIEGATWFTGGQFGPEGSIQATLFCLIAAIILLVLSHRAGKIVKPFWKTERHVRNQSDSAFTA